MKKFYRVCHRLTDAGLWYCPKGEFTGLIHNKFNFCANSALEMEYDPDIVGYVSVTDDINTLYQWFTKEDIAKLQEHDYYIHLYECDDYWFYERFQHWVMKQDKAKLLEIIVL